MRGPNGSNSKPELGVYPHMADHCLWMALVVVLAVALFLASSQGCVSDAAITQARREAALNAGHAADEKLPAKARMIAQDNADAWHVQRYNLDGTEVPEDVRKRIEARK